MVDRAKDKGGPAPAGPAAGETFGHYLLRERELRGFSLQQISDQTRIGVGNLKALEGDELSRLPSRVFVLGYIRAYAQAIGLSADEAVLRFEEQSQKEGPPAEREVRRRSRRGLALLAVGVLAAAALVAAGYLLLGHG
ncbi:MAG: helix-turn-helix domain-containing protein [Deltaproteobacteria bacterium]|nr:helix-turn-helix domain-containing protein [Deltaproteobacteria bacterium]